MWSTSDEKGLTLPEIAISILIFSLFAIMSYQFIENYTVESMKTGDYSTARLLTISAIEDARIQYQKDGTKTNKNYEFNKEVNGFNFKTTVQIEDRTDEMVFVSDRVYMAKITATTYWKTNQVGAETYVTKESYVE